MTSEDPTHGSTGASVRVRLPTATDLVSAIRSRALWDLVAVLVVFAPVRFALFPPSGWFSPPFRLAEEAYREPIIVMQALQAPAFVSVVGSALLVAVLGRLPFRRNPFHGRVSWAAFSLPYARLILMALALPVAWKFSTHDINTWLDQAHAVDRILVAVCWLGIAFNPVFVPLFAAVAAVVAAQFYYPSCFHFTWADKAVNFYALLLFWVVFVVSRFRNLGERVYPFLLGCMFAAFYFYPAVAKFIVGTSPLTWPFHNQVHHLYLGAALNGWFPDLDVLRIAGAMQPFDRLIQVGTLVIELGVVVAMLDRRLAVALFAGALGLHAGIFVVTGIFFWEWMVPEAVMVWLFVGPWHKRIPDLFGHPVRWLAPALVVGAMTWAWPYFLGWLDSPYYHVYDLELEDVNGETLELDRGYLDPFQLAFTQNRLGFADPEPVLNTGTYGSTGDTELFYALREATSLEEIEAIEAERGQVRLDEEELAEFQLFLHTFFSAMNEGENEAVPAWLESIHHQYSVAGETPNPETAPIRFVRLRVQTLWYDETQLHDRGERQLFEIDLAAPAPGSTAR